MNKEAVLNKAKLEKNEEFENTVSQKATAIGSIALAIICGVVFAVKVVVSDMRGLEKVTPFYDILAVLTGYVSVVYFVVYRKINEKKYLLISIGALIIFALCIFKFIYTL
ncbi:MULTISPECIES: DUF6442 family protein [unclassified Clostridioides]|uniref:DUF6442 family protein n=1 Tax=unclassified Clostridioides TaxID=2635829 RepID=UPI001D0CB55E|nr:hypothetical protein [Clostridioides sp. ES-S-0001-02]MCC0642242.1 hypothetical protein [Clostridioides sp. ES-S-0049-03]MCC0653523.1 hypothetical protein [Clostridioides sp. ES-S-0001-03]MCC0671245.1 hypothetical protein [Clostridioides sp. ES-S-0145-01]MCC0674947.1 hypothetical protein [Clostridioides sp. ES-W-0018-02]MCC0679478.1 hypothetical protein [Clostridioides sp. ES-S-0005-03]MCC0697121.1 hypothetical protein [Clostridioides sp. ES-S-0048-02]MCC0710239.1 hypothetical protein [Cl